MIDTIVAVIEPDKRLDAALFDGGSSRIDADQVKLWRNPSGDGYQPRVTYYTSADVRDRGRLKLECSLSKMLGVELDVLTNAQVHQALDLVNVFVREFIGALPDVREWRCNRIDYYYSWELGNQVGAYMSVIQSLQCRTYQRHPFGESGVVWKSRGIKGRWVKFYDNTKEAGLSSPAVLRFEISNYRDAVRYMAASWFACARSVGELVHPGRALYVLCAHFDLLGLGQQSIEHESVMDFKLRDAFGRGVARASFMLKVISQYGAAAYKDDVMLVARSTYYHWRKLLRDSGFLTAHDDVRDDVSTLEPLGLPVSGVIDELMNNSSQQDLVNNPVGPTTITKKIPREILGIAPGAADCRYLGEVMYA